MTEIMNKIHKLLALAQDAGATEAEAATAMSMASALMQKHAIDEAKLAANDPSKKATTVHRSFTFDGPNDKFLMWVIIAASELTSCRTLRYDFNQYDIIGRKDAAEACEVLAVWIKSQIDALYKRDLNLAKSLPLNRRGAFRVSYKQAAAVRVLRRAQEIVAAMQSNDAKAIAATGSTALVVVASIRQQLAEAQSFIESNFKTRKAKPLRQTSGLGRHAGRKAGDEVKLNRELG